MEREVRGQVELGHRWMEEAVVHVILFHNQQLVNLQWS